MLVSTLLSWDSAALSTRAAEIATVARAVEETTRQLTGRTGPTLFAEGVWTGAASDAAQDALQERLASMQALQRVLDDATAALAEFASWVAAARHRLSSALAAAAADFLVHDDGRVEIVPLVPPGPAYDDAGRQIPNPSPNLPVWTVVERGRLATLIEGALADAQAADERCAAVLADLEVRIDAALAVVAPRALRRLNQEEIPAFLWAQWLLTIPPGGSDPDAVAEWWACADEATRLRLLREHPELLGNLAGLPPADRDRANRLALSAGLAETRAEIAALEELIRTHPEELLPMSRRLDELRARLGFFAAVQHGLSYAEGTRHAITKQARQVHLLIMDPDAFDGARGRAAIAFGDVARADHVAYVVPGLRQWVDPELHRTVTNALNLQTAAEWRNPGGLMATVAWIGYDAPGAPTVGLDGRARHGADRLADEVRGLLAVRRLDDPHLTVVGHSYGSTTSALAVQRHADLGIDDLVLVGSPGAGTGDVADLHLPADHVWVGSASGDAVSHLGRFGGDPAAQDFGFRFQAETPVRKSYPNIAEHSQYFAPNSESLMNLSRIMAADYADVVQAPDRDYVQTYSRGGPVMVDPEEDRAVTTQPTHELDGASAHP